MFLLYPWPYYWSGTFVYRYPGRVARRVARSSRTAYLEAECHPSSRGSLVEEAPGAGVIWYRQRMEGSSNLVGMRGVRAVDALRNW